jgi:hypothetical protein
MLLLANFDQVIIKSIYHHHLPPWLHGLTPLWNGVAVAPYLDVRVRMDLPSVSYRFSCTLHAEIDVSQCPCCPGGALTSWACLLLLRSEAGFAQVVE